MILSFATQAPKDIFNGRSTKVARRTCPQNLWRIAGRKLDQMDSVESLSELRIPPGNWLESLLLPGSRQGQFSIRVNEQYRVCFRWTDTGPANVEIVDYH